MDLLSGVVGSAVRADVLAALFGSPARRYGLVDLSRALRHPHQPVLRELKRLASFGLVRSAVANGKRTYTADVAQPQGRELAAFVRQARGRIPSIRRTLVALRSPTLAWLMSPSLLRDAGARDRSGMAFVLVVLTGAPRSLVRVQLLDVLGADARLLCMTAREWVARLDKGDVDLRRARRARKVWVLGSWAELVSRERGVIEARRTLEHATSNWQEELSDDWDDEWDPARVALAPTR